MKDSKTCLVIFLILLEVLVYWCIFFLLIYVFGCFLDLSFDVACVKNGREEYGSSCNTKLRREKELVIFTGI